MYGLNCCSVYAAGFVCEPDYFREINDLSYFTRFVDYLLCVLCACARVCVCVFALRASKQVSE